MIPRFRNLVLAALAGMLALFTAGIAAAQSQPLPDQVRDLTRHTAEGVAAAEAGKPELMRAEYEELHAIWGGFEQQVGARDPKGYADIEAALDQLKAAAYASPPDPAAVKAAYTHLGSEITEVADRLAAAPAAAPTPGLAGQVRSLATHTAEGAAAAEAGKPELMRAEYEELHAIWAGFEQQVGTRDPKGYVDIEAALDQLKAAAYTTPPDPAAVKAAYTHLGSEITEVADRLATAPAEPASAPAAAPAKVTPAGLLATVSAVDAALAQGDADTARARFDDFIRAWPSAEDQIATRSNDDYHAIEATMGTVAAALRASPADLAGARAALGKIQATLAPYSTASAYTAVDAAAIILREGLEALLVIIALLAFLTKSGNRDKRGWIWAGGALGVLASLLAALLLQMLFNNISAGRNRELIEGIIGLIAAAMLFYVSYWLHSKASLHAWQRYINQQTTRALARGSMAGLGLLAFLAVFREGAETAVFYLGMAPSIAMRDMLLGIGIGAAVLVVLAVLMLVVGVKLPLRPFFRIAGLLVYYLGFKFVGTGIHALQVAGAIPASPIGDGSGNALLEFFGIYLTWQTLLPQLALLAGALAAFLYLRAQDRRARGLSTAAA